MSETIKYAGDYNLEIATILSYQKGRNKADVKRLEIKNLIQLLNIYEDVMSPAITGDITLIDARDIRTMLPLTGMERLELKLFTPGVQNNDMINYTEELTEPLYIYKVEKVRPGGGTSRLQAYRIFFTSREAYRNNICRVTKSFKGAVEDGVHEIVRDKSYLDSRKKFFVEETATNTAMVIPNLKPFAAIRMLAKHAKSEKYENAGFLFYETTQGFHFRSIESLLAVGGHTGRPVKKKFQYKVADMRKDGSRDILDELERVESYSFTDTVNMLENMTSGMAGSRLISHDAFYKTITIKDYDYHNEYHKHFHTEVDKDGNRRDDNFMIPYANFDDTRKNITEQPTMKIMVKSDTSKRHNDYENIGSSSTLQSNISQKEQMMNGNLVLNALGDTRLHVGDLINFELPYQKPVGPDEKQELNPYWSGRYIVLQLKHSIDMVEQKHGMVIRAAKDSTRTPIPVESAEMVVKLQDGKHNSTFNIYEEDNNIQLPDNNSLIRGV